MKLLQQLDCPYYPCSFEGQSCKYCYCPLYPCRLPDTGGHYVETATGYKLWDCSKCEVIHKQAVVYLLGIDPNETNEKILKDTKEKLKSYLRGE